MRAVDSPTHLSPGALQRVMTGAWPPVETEALGEWLLRAGHGFTGRANSALAVGDPGLPLHEALAQVRRWYAARGLVASLVVAGPPELDLAGDPVASLALVSGWRDRVVTLTLTAPADQVAGGPSAAAPTGSEVTVTPCMDDGWFEALTRYRAANRAAVSAVLHGSPEQRFVTERVGEQVVGIGRLGVSDGWGGIGAMWVDPAHRRQGVAGRLLNTLAQQARGLGVAWLHLQTDSDNAAALAVYARAGFATHHGYVYLTDSSGRATP